MSNLTAEIIPNVGHTLNMEQPETINARILEFLSSDEC
jgi:pimeloyl-ACP methyl ester carboxylesterase